MAVVRYKVLQVNKEFDGNFCEVKAEIISVHRILFRKNINFIAEKELQIGEEFQENNLIKKK